MKLRLLFIAAVGLAGLFSCTGPPAPRFQTDPTFYSDTAPAGYEQADVAPTTDATQPAPVSQGGYPTAQRTANPEQVISPYEPYNVIDVAGFASGKLARDPSNQKIFRVP